MTGENSWRTSRWVKGRKTYPGTLKMLESPCRSPVPIDLLDNSARKRKNDERGEGIPFVHESPLALLNLAINKVGVELCAG